MNVVKWFLYLVALGGFIWFVFFRSPSGKTVVLSGDQKDTTTENAIDNKPTQTTGENLDIDYSYSEEYEESSTENSADESDAALQTDDSEVDIKDEPLGINTSNTYLVVLGSFGVKANADKLLQKTIQNIGAAEMKYINGLYRVIAASSNSEQVAEQRMDELISEYQMKAFVLEQ